MDIKAELQTKAEWCNEVIDGFLPKEEGFQKTIFSAVNYSIRVGGKRLRPVLMYETFKLFGGTGDAIYNFMAALEMIHTYSLVHDDLPAMDNDMYRRGKKTTHAVYGEAMGILAGDALLNLAYETASEAFFTEGAGIEVAKALKVLGRNAGIYGMVGGQVVDVESENNPSVPVTREKLDFIYDLKTGALIESAMVIGAILAKADDSDVEKVSEAAKKIGLAFQIQDDILDVTSTFEELGKPIGSDEKNNKATYVTFEGLEKAKADVKRISDEAVALLNELPGDKEFITGLALYLVDRKN